MSVAIAPAKAPWLEAALNKRGFEVEPLTSRSRALVWLGFHDPAGLAIALQRAPHVEWVQLPSAGIDDFVRAGVLDKNVAWTSAKGAYSRPVAEHALTLTLALLREIPRRSRVEAWGTQSGTSLYGKRVVIVGAGGVAQELIRLLSPFDVDVTVIRRRAEPLNGATSTLPFDRLRDSLEQMDVLVLAAPLTDGTRGLIGASELDLMQPTAVLVNVARGGLIDTEALVQALASHRIAGAALDVTDPEPLPDGHPLWTEPRALITPHTADTWPMIEPLLAQRIVSNVARFEAGAPLEGRIDLERGY